MPAIRALRLRYLAINRIHDCMDAGGRATQEQLPRTQMTLIVMIDADFSWIIRVYHNHLRRLEAPTFGICVPLYLWFIFCELP